MEGEGRPAFLPASTHPGEGRKEQVSDLYGFFFLKLSVFICFHMAEGVMQNAIEIGLESSRKLLVAGASCKRSPVVPGNRGLGRAIFAWSPNSTLFPWGHVVLTP